MIRISIVVPTYKRPELLAQVTHQIDFCDFFRPFMLRVPLDWRSSVSFLAV